jgi:hypothetical protein
VFSGGPPPDAAKRLNAKKNQKVESKPMAVGDSDDDDDD